MKVLRWEQLGFEEARREQERLVAARQRGETEDVLMVLEHPPTLSLGIRAERTDPRLSPELWTRRNVEVVATNRGGEATFHGPGQLIFYPVILLPARRLGVREFVRRGLEAFAAVASGAGLKPQVKLQPAGVWLSETKKLASVGLRIERGVTNHGFAFNICCDLSFFSGFPICGELQARATSLEAEFGLLNAAEFREKSIQAFIHAVGRNSLAVESSCQAPADAHRKEVSLVTEIPVQMCR